MGEPEVRDGGVYLERIRSRVGTGDTSKNSTMENFWLAQRLPDGGIRMELLDNQDQPSGYAEIVDHEEFSKRFVLQEDFQPRSFDPQKERADKIAARAERHYEQEEYLSAEYEFSSALKLDQENVRANYGLGKTFLAQGEADKAKDIFGKLAHIQDVMLPTNKFIFNECGIQLRKLGMFGEAISFYRRALELEKNDENLWFNLGRALMDAGAPDKAAAALKRALALKPGFAEARQLLNRLGA
jgi:tetratricopeptide (TPR) repeat protein